VDFLRPVRAFDSFQQRRKWLAIPMAVVKKFGDDQGGSLAALVAYYAFFSIFPILLVFTTILGFVLQGDSTTRESVVGTITKQIPVVGSQLHITDLKGSVSAIVIGLVTSLLAGLGVTNAAQNAFDRVWAVPFKQRPDFLKARLRGLGLLVSLGLLFILATGASALVAQGLHGIWAKAGGVVLSLIINAGLFLAAFRFLTAAEVSTRELRVGVAVAAVLWEILQVVGTIYIGHVLKNAQSHYAFFATVIALLVFLHLGAQLTLYAAEVNVVVTRKLWPRSLIGPPQSLADEETLTALAKVEERHEVERVDVAFDATTPPSQNS
jgi:YihY family inner membrane protein